MPICDIIIIKKKHLLFNKKKTLNPILRTLFNPKMEGMYLSLILQLLFMRCVNATFDP